MHKYGESKTTQIMMATVHHVTSSSGLRKFQARLSVHGCIMASEIGAEQLHGIRYRLSGSIVRHSKAHTQNFLLGEWVPSPEAIYNVCLISKTML